MTSQNVIHTFESEYGSYEVCLIDLGACKSRHIEQNGKHMVMYVVSAPNGDEIASGSEFYVSPIRKNPTSRKVALELLDMIAENIRIDQVKRDFLNSVDNGDLGIEIADLEELGD
jgi:hypothetical protein